MSQRPKNENCKIDLSNLDADHSISPHILGEELSTSESRRLTIDRVWGTDEWNAFRKKYERIYYVGFKDSSKKVRISKPKDWAIWRRELGNNGHEWKDNVVDLFQGMRTAYGNISYFVDIRLVSRKQTQ